MPDLNLIKQAEQGARDRRGRPYDRPIESAADIASAIKAVIAGPAATTTGEAERIAAVGDTFVGAIDASDFDRRLQELEGASKRAARPALQRRGRPRLYNR
jgi:hypothetical protein